MLFFILLGIVFLTFLIPLSVVVFYLVLRMKLWRMGKSEANLRKITSGRNTIISCLFGFLSLSIAFCFVIYLFLGWEL